jgi:hypothetical protein
LKYHHRWDPRVINDHSVIMLEKDLKIHLDSGSTCGLSYDIRREAQVNV